MQLSRILTGIVLGAIAAAMIPSTSAHAHSAPGPKAVFSAPSNVEIEADTNELVSKTIRFTNTGNKKTSKLNVSFNANYGLNYGSSTCVGKRIQPGKSCKTILTYQAGVPSEATSTLTVFGVAQSVSTTVHATATTPASQLSVDPASYTASSDTSSATYQFTFTNETGETLSGSFNAELDMISDWAITTGNCWTQTSMAPEATCLVNVSYERSGNGAKAANLYVTLDGVRISDPGYLESQSAVLG